MKETERDREHLIKFKGRDNQCNDEKMIRTNYSLRNGIMKLTEGNNLENKTS